MLLWALELAQLPPYDRPFDAERLVAHGARRGDPAAGDEIERRARRRGSGTGAHARRCSAADGEVELPPEWQSFDQLVGATAMRGFERGLLPRPLRGDFPAFGAGLPRARREEQQDEAHQIAWQRHRALNWLCGLGKTLGRPCRPTP